MKADSLADVFTGMARPLGDNLGSLQVQFLMKADSLADVFTGMARPSVQDRHAVDGFGICDFLNGKSRFFDRDVLDPFPQGGRISEGNESSLTGFMESAARSR
jgi:hypothetical protein